MTDPVFDTPRAFLTKKRTTHIPVHIVTEKDYESWLKKQPAATKNQAEQEGFNPKGKHTLIVKNDKGKVKQVYAGVHDKVQVFDLSRTAAALQSALSSDFLKKISFEIKTTGLDEEELTHAHIGWALGCYRFEAYKSTKALPGLLWSKAADRKRIKAFVESTALLRNMVNIPANDMGPDEMEETARAVAGTYDAKIKVIKDKQLLTQNYPLIHAVGDASPRRPRLIEISWGDKKNPKVTIVGKGVVFDTGGLNLKPGQYMALMKKDMAGAAHALALGRMVMALKLPINLRVLLPVTENAVSGPAFRPGDAMKSRKGLIVENKNTDAEGRLILADALTAASEEKPDLIIDFATLTGSARAALGTEIAAMFSNNEEMGQELQDLSISNDDPLWQMPLWDSYQRYIENGVGDLVNSVDTPGDLIYSALFLQSFLVGKPNWIHLDCYAWEQTGRPGRPRGGCDTGLRAVFAFLEQRYNN